MKLKLFILTGILILLIGNFVISEGKSELLGVLDFSENGANKLVVEGHEINLLEKGSKVQVVKEEDGSITINLIGKGSIKFDGSQTPLNNIANAKVKLKEEEIKYAEFDSVEGGLYFFRKGEEEIRISANKGGKVVYDMDKNEIGGENVWVSYKQNEIKGKGNTKVFLDKEGNILYASISAGEFEDKERKLIYSSKENFEVRFDKLVEELYKGNAVSFKGDMVNMKGKVNVYNEEFGISYEGIGENVVAEYNPIFQNFDIHNGDALISNGKHEVLFDNGKIKLSGALKDIGKAETFGFRYVKDEDTPDKYLRINEEFERFDMVAFNEDKKGMFIIENLGDFEKNALANYESQSTNLFDSAISLEKQGFKSEAIEIYKQIFNSYSEGSEERRYALEMYLRATKGEEIQEVDFAKGGFSNSGGYGFEYDSENGIIKL